MNGRTAKKLRREARRQVRAGGQVGNQVSLRVHTRRGGAVKIEFGVPLSELVLPAGQARRFADAILKHADEADPPPKPTPASPELEQEAACPSS